MSKTDYSLRAAAADNLIRRTVNLVGAPHRDSIRTLLRIAFEVQAFLHSQQDGKEDLEWVQDAVFSGCDSLHLARSAWQSRVKFEQLDQRTVQHISN